MYYMITEVFTILFYYTISRKRSLMHTEFPIVFFKCITFVVQLVFKINRKAIEKQKRFF